MRAIIFILLKIIEAAAVIFGPYLLGSIYYWIRNFEGKTTFETWMCGVVMLVITFIFIVIVILLIDANLKLSKKITERLKE